MKLASHRFIALALSAAFAGPAVLQSQDKPTTQPASTDQLRADIELQNGQLQDVLDSPAILADPDRRNAVAAQVIPGLKKIVADLDALGTADPDHLYESTQRRGEYVMFLSLFGDPAGTNRLKDEAASDEPNEQFEGQRLQLMVRWIKSAQDANAQNDIADQIQKMAKDNPGSEDLAYQLYAMSRLGPASTDQAKRAIDIMTTSMRGEVVDSIKKQMQQSQAMAVNLENKPLTIAGTKVDGSKFTTDDWKGKVVLVDFWATWCGPCLGEIPHVKEMYDKYHAKGLEIVGVSNDQSAEALTKFMTDHPELPWPQLFDAPAAAKQQWNPITTGFGINGIPTMFLIDKKGVLRTVSARENMDDMIPKLLGE
jgi:thiol-disulfide isomerase/thioredoxin